MEIRWIMLFSAKTYDSNWLICFLDSKNQTIHPVLNSNEKTLEKRITVISPFKLSYYVLSQVNNLQIRKFNKFLFRFNGFAPHFKFVPSLFPHFYIVFWVLQLSVALQCH